MHKIRLFSSVWLLKGNADVFSQVLFFFNLKSLVSPIYWSVDKMMGFFNCSSVPKSQTVSIQQERMDSVAEEGDLLLRQIIQYSLLNLQQLNQWLLTWYHQSSCWQLHQQWREQMKFFLMQFSQLHWSSGSCNKESTSLQTETHFNHLPGFSIQVMTEYRSFLNALKNYTKQETIQSK